MSLFFKIFDIERKFCLQLWIITELQIYVIFLPNYTKRDFLSALNVK